MVSTSTLVSCKDYDDDISRLQEQIDADSKAISDIQNLIKSGSVITSVAPNASGIVVTLSNGNTFNLTNGEDGTPGTAWTIGADGYWYKDGVKTDYRAIGEKGDKGDKGDTGAAGADGANGTNGADGANGANGADGADGENGQYYVPNPETGCFDIYQNGEKVQSTTISYVASGSITATLSNSTLTLNGVNGTTGAIVISLSGDLRSLVFMPTIYLDGIETIEYPWIHDSILAKVDGGTFVNRQGKTVRNTEDYQLPAIIKTYNYGPAWSVQYHMNPSNSSTVYDDIKGYSVLNPEVYYTTRAISSSLGVTSPEKNFVGTQLFLNCNGILTAGLQIKHPELLEKHPTDSYENYKDNTIALQVGTKSGNGEEATVTSDYALLRPTEAWLEGLVWVKKPTYAAASASRVGDENCTLDATKRVHVYDTPKEALQDADGAALELYFDSEEGIKIGEMLGIHYVKESLAPRANALKQGTWKYGEEGAWGLKYEFNLIDYSVDGNVTRDSRYAKWVDQANGVIRAWNVKYDGTHADGESATAVDREPLVQVLVKNADGDVVLDGYILIHIARQAPDQAPNKIIDLYPTQKAQFDLCNDKDVFVTNWSMFNDYILTQGMENMTKEEFDAQYEPDLASSSPVGTNADGNPYYKMNIFTSAPAKGNVSPESPALGLVTYTPNTMGTTNHRFDWTLSAEELEKLTHESAPGTVKTVTRYIRFKAIPGSFAQKPYIFVKMTVDLTRATIGTNKFGEKINNYWFSLTGQDGGKEAIVFDVKEPTDGGNINSFTRGIRSTLVNNVENTTGTHKYYFAPINVTVKDENNGGATYTITSASSAADVNYNNIFCKYITAPVADKHAYSVDKLNELLENCAIDYAKGAFNNDALYAVIGSTYTKIATLNQATGEISLIKNDQCKLVLNAVGYTANHANINTEMRTWVGVVSSNGCGLAQKVTDGTFLVSWQRPINMKDIENKVAIDANTNGNIINIFELIKLFDWRGEDAGYMWDDHQWFWVYYGVNAITIDTTPANVLTNMHQANSSTFVKLSSITTEAELYCYPSMTKGAVKYNLPFGSYNAQNQNAALLNDIALNKDSYGSIYYANNGDNVTEFDVKIPVTIEYTWGKFTKTMTLHINRTTGH